MRLWLLSAALALGPLAAAAQTAGEVERCFQNPAGCSQSGSAPQAVAPAPAPSGGGGGGGGGRVAPPDYTTVLHSPEPDRRKLQESLRTLDKYNGPIDGDLQSEATTKAITDWQKGHGYAAVGKLTPTEAVTLNNEAARVPIRRVNPSSLAAAAPATPLSNADALKALRARQAERRKAAEPKAAAATLALFSDLKVYLKDGKGVAGEQFTAFAKWYADNKAAGRAFGDITPNVEDYGDAKDGQAVTSEVTFLTKQGESTYPQCLVFAWIEGAPRKNTQAFTCNDVAAVEKWKSEQALRSAWR